MLLVILEFTDMLWVCFLCVYILVFLCVVYSLWQVVVPSVFVVLVCVCLEGRFV